MIGISIDNHPLEMPILARRLGGMTLHVAVRRTARAAASPRGGPLFAFAHRADHRRLLPEQLRRGPKTHVNNKKCTIWL